MPLEVFPTQWQPALRWLPFATVVYGPARIFVAPDAGLAFNVGKVQLASLIVFVVIAAAIQRIAIKRIQSNGG
jgi:ABC-2 type transport system permease protein